MSEQFKYNWCVKHAIRRSVLAEVQLNLHYGQVHKDTLVWIQRHFNKSSILMYEF